MKSCVAKIFICSLFAILGAGAVEASYSTTELLEVLTPEERRLREIRQEEIEQYRMALSRRVPTNRRVDLYVRLSETYFEAYRSTFLGEGRIHEQRLAEGRADPFIDRTLSKPYLKDGVKACEEVIGAQSKHPKLDQVYYILSVNYDELGDAKAAERTYAQLIQKFPRSPYTPEAHRALGELLYLRANYREALVQYQAALRTSKVQKQPRLLQKTAWTHYRLKQFDQAIATIQESIGMVRKDASLGDMKEELFSDAALFMTEAGQMDEAIRYFQQVSGDQEFYLKTLEKFASIGERQGNTAQAIQIYEALIRSYPTTQNAVRARIRLFEIDLKKEQYAVVYRRSQALSQVQKRDDLTEESFQHLRVALRKRAIEQHDDFRKTQNKQSLIYAENLYASYLVLFGVESKKSGELPELQMYMAEVKRDLGKSQEAAQLYQQVLSSKDDRFAKQAAAFWMTSLGDSIKKAKSGHSAADLQDLESEYVEACKAVMDRFGDLSEGLSARLSLAQVWAGRTSQNEKAYEQAEYVFEKSPKTASGLTAAKLMLQIREDQWSSANAQEREKNEKALRKVIAEFKESPDLQPPFKESLESVETRLQVGAIRDNVASRNFKGAAAGFESIGDKSKNKKDTENAYQSAVEQFTKARDFDSAIRILSKWFKKIPGSSMALDSLRKSATFAMVDGQFEKAAFLFRILGRSNDPNALELAGRLFEGVGNLTEAAQDFKFYLDKFPNAAETGSIALSLSQWYEYSKNDPKAIQFYNMCWLQKSRVAAECGVQLALLYQRLERPGLRDGILKQVAQKPRGSENSPWVGYARFKLASDKEKSRVFPPLKLPDTELKKGLEERTRFLKEITNEYQAVVDAPGAWGVAALDRLGSFVFRFAQDIDAIAPPKNDPAVVKAFREGLKQISDPLRGQAYGAWKTAYEKAQAKELLSPVLPEVVDRLAGIGFGVSSQGVRDVYRLTGKPADGGAEGPTQAFQTVRNQLFENAKDEGAWIDYGNLLWGQGRPLLAKIAYERALSIQPKSARALNNRGVLILSGVGQEDWIRVVEAATFFKAALEKNDMFLAAKFNQASLYNYFRLFERAVPIWKQIIAASPEADAYESLGIAQLGLGMYSEAELSFSMADNKSGGSRKNWRPFSRASLAAFQKKDYRGCVSNLEDLKPTDFVGFERESYDRLKDQCQRWKSQPKGGNS